MTVDDVSDPQSPAHLDLWFGFLKIYRDLKGNLNDDNPVWV